MKTLSTYISEKLKISKGTKSSIPKITERPKDGSELSKIIKNIHQECLDNTSYYMDLRHIDVSQIDDFTELFWRYNKAETIDITGWKTTQVTRMESMFKDCKNLKYIIGLDTIDTSNVVTMKNMFQGCKSLEELDLSNFDITKVQLLNYMFENCFALKEIKGIDDSNKNWNMTAVRTTECMFYNCKELSNIGDISGWNVLNLRNISTMFYSCKKLNSSIGDLNNWHFKINPTKYLAFGECDESIIPSWAS